MVVDGGITVSEVNGPKCDAEAKSSGKVTVRDGIAIRKNGYVKTLPEKLPTGDVPAKKTFYVSDKEEEAPLWALLTTYLCYLVLIVFGHFRDFLRNTGIEKTFAATEKNRPGYIPLYQSFENFYTRNIFRRICDCWINPLCSTPGATIEIRKVIHTHRNWRYHMSPDETYKALNMGSYNYLGFAENKGKCSDMAEESIKKYGITVSSSRHEIGTLDLVKELEERVARFLGVEDSIVCGMGFATNSMSIPSLVGKGCLILSDEQNHASLILGCRLSGAVIRVFKHNDMKDLERKLRDGIAYGQPRTHRPWRKIIIVVEGVYSMEGSLVNLPAVIDLKKKYKAYLYLDEAHSIGATGKNGRGVTDYYGCDPKDVDCLMGTFTKSFGSAGGYIAGTRDLIQHLRAYSHSYCYGTSMAAPVAQQIITSMTIIMGDDGTDEGRRRIEQLARNSRYFRKKLKQMGFIVAGPEDSPVIPLLLYFPSKIAAFVRMSMERGIASVGVGFPAVPLAASRARFCMSASHTKEMLDQALAVTNDVGEIIGVKYSHKPRSVEVIEY